MVIMQQLLLLYANIDTKHLPRYKFNLLPL